MGVGDWTCAGQGLKRAGVAGAGWSWSPTVEAATCVSACVFPFMLMSPVCQCHVHTGSDSSCTHVQPSSASLPCLILPLHGFYLGGC